MKILLTFFVLLFSTSVFAKNVAFVKNSATERDYNEYKNTYVKVVIQKKTNPFWFDTMLDKLYEVDVSDLVVVENFADFDISDDDIIDEAQDTLTILGKHVDSLNVKNKEELNTLMRTLYNEALTVEAI